MLKDLSLHKTYSSETDNLIQDFYIPILSSAVNYKRLTGFFSSYSLLLASKGISHFFSTGGKYQLISGVELSGDDFNAIKNGLKHADDLLNEILIFEPTRLESEIELDHLKVLAWLISGHRLQIKIAIMTKSNSGIFHQKIGILEDKNGDLISFSGSINETAYGWLNNSEEFKVFRSWMNGEKDYLIKDCEKFNSYWNNNASNFTVIDLPKAIEQEILKIKPEEVEIRQIVQKLNDFEKISKKELKDYQLEAVSKWVENGYKGIFEMATGTGKTITALGAASKIYEIDKKCCVVIAVPYSHLATQWLRDIKIQLDNPIVVEAHGGERNWREKLSQFLGDYEDGFLDKMVILTLYDTLSSEDFLKIFKNKFNQDRNYLIIADEVHNFGAPQYSRGMLDEIIKRLALSATPTRAFDEIGTDRIQTYFDKTVYEYDMKRAIENNILTPYDYNPIFVEMSGEELQEYLKITSRIRKNIGNKDNIDDYIKLLYLKRSKVLKNAKSKLERLKGLIKELNDNNKIEHLLIYCDSGGQLSEVQKILGQQGIINHKFTEDESINDRKKLLLEFDYGTYGCLVAVRCLDEGVDVPSTRTAIIVASSSNPREYIQRRGRVLRKFPGKEKAVIYDFIVLPPEHIEDETIFNIEQKILKKELQRTQEFMETSSNKAFIWDKLSDIMLRYKVFLD